MHTLGAVLFAAGIIGFFFATPIGIGLMILGIVMMIAGHTGRA